MNLTDKQVQHFIEAWRQDFGEELSLENAEKEIVQLVVLGRKLAASEDRQRAVIAGSGPTEIYLLSELDNLKAVWRQAMRKRLNKRS